MLASEVAVVAELVPLDRRADVLIAYFDAVASQAESAAFVGRGDAFPKGCDHQVDELPQNWAVKSEVSVSSSVSRGAARARRRAAARHAGGQQGLVKPATFCGVPCEPLGSIKVQSELSYADSEADDIGGGVCYLQMFVPSVRDAALAVLGAYPTSEQLLRVPAAWIVDDVANLRVSRVGVDTYHIGLDGPVPLLECFASVLHKVEGQPTYGSFGATVDNHTYDLVLASKGPTSGSRFGASAGEAASAVVCEWLKAEQIEFDETRAVVFCEHMAVAMRAQAFHSAESKNELRMLAAVGDAVLTLALASDMRCLGSSAHEYQQARSRVTRNEALSLAFIASPLFAGFLCVGDALSAKVGGEAVEAVLGATYAVFGMQGARVVIDKMKLIDVG